MRSAVILAALLLASCGEPVRDDHFANQAGSSEPAEQAAQAPTVSAMPVRIGELGPNFNACATVGTTRRIAPGERLPVRTAPFDNAAEAGGIAAGSSFFVCSRSLDQRWLGVVFHDNGSLDESCGVSRPVPARRAYDGPCRSGWVSSASVRLTAGIEQPPAANHPQPAGEGA